MSTKSKTINGVVYEFIKDVPSDTKVRGWHVIANKKHYVILHSPMPLDYISVFSATRTGRAEDLGSPIIRFRGNDLQSGADALIDLLSSNLK